MKVYIEAGANNGIEQSRSLQFKDNDEYFGILVEPDSNAFIQCLKNKGGDTAAIWNVALVDDKKKIC